MFEVVLSFLDEVSRNFRLVDALDIFVVAIFVYAGMVWFKKTASRGVLIGVGALSILYFVARSLDMYLTSLAFHTTFAVLLLILVVVFQEDLRRMFEQLSALRSVRIARGSHSRMNSDELVASVFKMAGNKTGALIVIKGKEPLERHLDSGIVMGGEISAPLLYSIFDSRTPGHDGAVIVDRNRIEQFAAHLPISKNTKEISGRGTRHSAALGLSERSDALTIVVSEERGVVTIAEAGKLKEAATAAQLKKRLDDYFIKTFPDVHQPIWRRIFVQHMLLKAVSIILAFIAWLVLAFDPSIVQRTFVVPVKYRNLPQQLVLDEDAPSECRVTLSGSERDFRFLDPATLTLTLDLSNTKLGTQDLVVDETSLRLPANLFPYRIDPKNIRLKLTRKAAEQTGENAND